MSEQFENSIRKKLEEADVPFDPAAWDKMKKRLDDSDRRRPVFWWWTSGLILILLLSAGGWWYAHQQPASQQSKVEAPDEKIITTPVDKSNSAAPANSAIDNTTTPVSENTIIDPANTSAGNVSAPVSEKSTTTSANTSAGNITAALTKNRTNPANIGNAVNNAPGKINSSKSTTRDEISSQPDNSATNIQQPITKKDPTTNSISDPGNKSSTSQTVNQGTKVEPNNSTTNQVTKAEPNKATIVNNSPVINKPILQIRDTTANTYTNVDNKKDSSLPKVKKNKRGFEGGITLGPDFNIAPSFKMGKIGFGGGLLVRYHVNNRLNISVAAVYTKKVYGATPKDYKFRYPTNYVRIDADCNVLDVPLNVHYTFLDRPKSTWSVMAGASSYFMMKEKYDYYWANNTKYTREFTNKNNHYFSVLNIGATWEKKTSGRLKWGIQPYIKIPLQGVGEGKVKLSSAGVALQMMLGRKD